MTATAGRRHVVLAALAGLLLVLALVTPILAADATSTPGAGGGDPRSPGQGPGLVGDPGFALGAVLVVGLLSLGLTLAWVHLTGPSRGAPPR